MFKWWKMRYLGAFLALVWSVKGLSRKILLGFVGLFGARFGGCALFWGFGWALDKICIYVLSVLLY